MFDLDDTLHYASPEIFKIINEDMTSFIMKHLKINKEKANEIRQNYWHKYGSTLRGLMNNHQVNPKKFLSETHNLENIEPLIHSEKSLPRILRNIKSDKVILTNAPKEYATFILEKIKVKKMFKKIICIEDNSFYSKPNLKIFKKIKAFGYKNYVMIDDSIDNIKSAKICNFKTVHISNIKKNSKYIDYSIKKINELLKIKFIN